MLCFRKQSINDWLFAATVFGQSLRLQPLSTEKKDLWKREMNCFMSICDYIVEVIPRSLGTNVEVIYKSKITISFHNYLNFETRDLFFVSCFDYR